MQKCNFCCLLFNYNLCITGHDQQMLLQQQQQQQQMQVQQQQFSQQQSFQQSAAFQRKDLNGKIHEIFVPWLSNTRRTHARVIESEVKMCPLVIA